MSLDEFREVNVDDEVVTKWGGIGIVAKRSPKCVQIINWITLTPQDHNHCSWYDISELSSKHSK